MPVLGEQRRGREIGKAPRQYFRWCSCHRCGNERWVQLGKGGPVSLMCINCYRIKTRHHTTRSITDRGYVILSIAEDHKYYKMARKPKKFKTALIFEHRLVMAEHIGRLLTREEIVHHKDGNKFNNNIENLELTSPGKHIVDHGKGYQDGYRNGMDEGFKAGLELAKKQERPSWPPTGLVGMTPYPPIGNIVSDMFWQNYRNDRCNPWLKPPHVGS